MVVKQGWLVFLVVFFSGCTTYGGQQQLALGAIDQGQYDIAEELIKTNIDENGINRLLYYLELGVVAHLAQNYQLSNQHLERAYQLSDRLQKNSWQTSVKVAFTNPNAAPYEGSEYEQVLIHYYKALNYILLSQDQYNEKLLDSARVEIKRMDILLDQQAFLQGEYAQAQAKQNSKFFKLKQMFRRLDGRPIDEELIQYRDDAWSHYLAGVSYEANGEYEDARISYERAANLYESGFAKQYLLDDSLATQAWFDAVRMKKVFLKDENWLEFARLHLSEPQIEKLDEFDQSTAQLVIIEHVGQIPARGEMNLLLHYSQWQRSLSIQLLPIGNTEQEIDQQLWFQMMYADDGLFDLFHRYRTGGIIGAVDGLNKTQSLGLLPIDGIAELLGIEKILSQSLVRITVPYMPAYRNKPKPNELYINGESYEELALAHSPAQLALQEQLRNANDELTSALARETLKAVTSHIIEKEADRHDSVILSLLSMASSLNTVTSARADTRNWLSLPYEIRLKRVALPQGEYAVEIQNQRKFTKLENGDVKVMVMRTKTNALNAGVSY